MAAGGKPEKLSPRGKAGRKPQIPGFSKVVLEGPAQKVQKIFTLADYR